MPEPNYFRSNRGFPLSLLPFVKYSAVFKGKQEYIQPTGRTNMTLFFPPCLSLPLLISHAVLFLIRKKKKNERVAAI